MRPGIVAFLLGALRGLLHPAEPRSERYQEEHDGVDPSHREVGSDPRAELAVAVLLVLAGLGAAAFAVLVAADPQTQLLGATLGFGLACLAAALILASKRVTPREIAVEERTGAGGEEQARSIVDDVRSGTEGVTRRRALGAAGAFAGLGVASAVSLPLTGLGPDLGTQPNDTPWRRGRRLVTTDGEPLMAKDIELGSFMPALPEGADKRQLGALVVVVRLDPATLRLPRARRGWAPEGILAYSQVCTHAGCSITLFRYPVNEATSSKPALVCPCHYSTFDPAQGAKPVFGPAARPLPQLPLRIAPDGALVANGPFSASIGPSWWGVKR